MTRESSALGPGAHGVFAQVSRKGLHAARDLGISISDEARDADLRRAVLISLISDPGLKTRHIGVAVRDGVVTLSGYVTCHAQKDAAGAAAHRIKGVDQVTDTIGVAVPCAEDAEAAPDGAERRRTLTLAGALARASAARETAPNDAQLDDKPWIPGRTLRALELNSAPTKPCGCVRRASAHPILSISRGRGDE